jgi:hypothetical protein
MPPKLHSISIAMIAIVLTGAIGCGGSATQPSSDGQVQVAGSVRDLQTNAAIGGALVTIGNATATTDPNGVYSVTVPVGQHQVSIDGESIGPVNMKDRTYRGDFYVHVNGCIARYERFSTSGRAGPWPPRPCRFPDRFLRRLRPIEPVGFDWPWDVPV